MKWYTWLYFYFLGWRRKRLLKKALELSYPKDKLKMQRIHKKMLWCSITRHGLLPKDWKEKYSRTKVEDAKEILGK